MTEQLKREWNTATCWSELSTNLISFGPMVNCQIMAIMYHVAASSGYTYLIDNLMMNQCTPYQVAQWLDSYNIPIPKGDMWQDMRLDLTFE